MSEGVREGRREGGREGNIRVRRKKEVLCVLLPPSTFIGVLICYSHWV